MTALYLAAAGGCKNIIYNLQMQGLHIISYRSFLSFGFASSLGPGLRAEKSVWLEDAEGCCSVEEYTFFCMEQGSNVIVKDIDTGVTPLHWAVELQHEYMVKLLLEKGIDINAGNFDGETALHLAVRNGSELVMRILLQNGADVNIQDRTGGCALHTVASNMDLLLAEFLLDWGADKDIKDKYGHNALFYAVANADKEMVLVLLADGTNFRICDQENDGMVDFLLYYPEENVISNLEELLVKYAEGVRGDFLSL